MAYEYLPSVYYANKDLENSRSRQWNSKKYSKVTVLDQVFQPILLLLRVAGRYPYSIKPSKEKELHYGWAVYSAVLAVLQFGGVYFTSIVAYRLSSNFDHKVFATVTVIICAILGFTPFLTWLEAPWLSAYLDKWTLYQDELRSFGVTLDTRLQKWLLLTILTLFPLLGIVSYFLDVRGGDPLAFLIYLLVQIGSYLLLTTWFFLVFFIKDTASRLLARIGDASAEREVATLKNLWLTLANLTVELGHVFSLSLILFIISCGIIGITNSYFLLFTLKDCFGGYCEISYNRNIPVITQMGFLVFTGIILICICEHGHRCTASLQALVQTILLRYPHMALGGYITLNRRLLTTMVTSAITYLIVLLQFRSTGGIKS